MLLYSIKLHYLQGVGLTEHLDTAQKADMRAYMSLITNVLGNAEVIKSSCTGNTFLSTG